MEPEGSEGPEIANGWERGPGRPAPNAGDTQARRGATKPTAEVGTAGEGRDRDSERDLVSWVNWQSALYAFVLGAICVFLVPLTGFWWIAPVLGAVTPVAVVLVGGDLLVTDLYVRPGGAVAGEHVHPRIEEWFTVAGGRVGFRLDGRESIAPHNERLHVPVGVAHDWWNAGEEEARPGPGSRR